MHGQERWLETASTSRTTVRLMVDNAETAAPIGLTGLWEIDWHNRSALTATKLHPESAGRGMGSDSIMTLMAWAFYVVGLHRLHSTILDYNTASVKAYVARCGWRVEGVEREAIFRKGDYVDLYRVAALRSDFDALPNAPEYVNRVCPTDVSDKVAL
jgi:RimJ/RimL family protein N-acetyltransferase